MPRVESIVDGTVRRHERPCGVGVKRRGTPAGFERVAEEEMVSFTLGRADVERQRVVVGARDGVDLGRRRRVCGFLLPA